jgi:predicted RNA-binding Zn-ribbon protein involved in translation (DUF1610 family)
MSDTCTVCGEQLSGSSHYHCPNCGGRCSMMGHVDAKGNYKCEMKPNPLNAAPPPQDAEQAERTIGASIATSLQMRCDPIDVGTIEWLCKRIDEEIARASAPVVAPQAAGEIDEGLRTNDVGSLNILDSRAGDIATVLKSAEARSAIQGPRSNWAWHVIGELLEDHNKLRAAYVAHVAKIEQQREIIEQAQPVVASLVMTCYLMNQHGELAKDAGKVLDAINRWSAAAKDEVGR